MFGELKSLADCLKQCETYVTNYEYERGIRVDGPLITLKEKDDIRIIAIKKSDNTHTIRVLLRASRRYDKWFIWCPTLGQLSIIETLKPIYEMMDKENNEKRNLHG